MSKSIKNEPWTIKQLICKINNSEIIKPKYQRKKKWDIMPKNDSTHKPNERHFIEFLFETCNSVHPITFGKNKDSSYTNIDGNNRINSLCHFIKKPFDIFPEYLERLNTYLKKTFEKNTIIYEEVKSIFRELSYTDIINFKYKNYFNDNKYNDLYKNYLQAIRDECEIFIEEIQNKLKTLSGDNFDNSVHINVNIFEGYNTDELCKIFEKINKYNSKLTDIELLASTLHNVNDFVISNSVIIAEIKNTLKQFYKQKADDESLDCYQYDGDDLINAYDFMVAFQNYSRTKCDLIEEVNNDGLSLFFKLYKIMYGGYDSIHFTSSNVNDFISRIDKTIPILVKIKNNIFTDIFTGKAFIDCKRTIFKLVRNNMFLIICAIFGYNNTNTQEEIIIKSIQKCLLYHFIIKEINDKDKKIEALLNDEISYKSGGAYIDTKAKTIYEDPSTISKNITSDVITDIIKFLIDENTIVVKCGENKRRPMKLYEKTLMYCYYKTYMPTNILDNKFSMEHICPFSCEYNGEIDINRLGNIIPIISSLNVKRGNKNISVYEKYDTDNTLHCLHRIIPSNDKYDTIMNHDNKLPFISDNDIYNDMCHKNEEEYIKAFIKYL